MENVDIIIGAATYSVPGALASDIQLLNNSYAKFLKAAANMRHYQKEYFLHRRNTDLVNAKIYEKQVDHLLTEAQVTTNETPKQTTLFHNGEKR